VRAAGTLVVRTQPFFMPLYTNDREGARLLKTPLVAILTPGAPPNDTKHAAFGPFRT
jgi:hypothetical protein